MYMQLHSDMTVLYSSQPIEDWTSVNLAEWMATVNLSRYVEVFRKNRFIGSQVKDISDHMLKSVSLFTWYLAASFY